MALSVYCGNLQNEGVVRTFIEAVIPRVPSPHIDQLFKSIEFWAGVRNNPLASINHSVNDPYKAELPDIGAVVILADQNWRRDPGESMRDILLGQPNDLKGMSIPGGFNPRSGKFSAF